MVEQTAENRAEEAAEAFVDGTVDRKASDSPGSLLHHRRRILSGSIEH